MKQLTCKFLWHFLWLVRLPFVLCELLLIALAIPFDFIIGRINRLMAKMKRIYWGD